MNTAADTHVVQTAIQQLLKERLDRYGFERAEIHAGRDHSGDPALFIDAFYHFSTQPIQTALILHLLAELRRLLLSKGEQRFLYVRHRFDEKQQVAKAR